MKTKTKILGTAIIAIVLLIAIGQLLRLTEPNQMQNSTSPLSNAAASTINYLFGFSQAKDITIDRKAVVDEKKQLQDSAALISNPTNTITTFSFVFDNKQAKDFTILGTAGLGKKITLLEKDSSNTCIANTVAHKVDGWDNPIYLTVLDADQHCGPAKLYSVAVVDMIVKDYGVISYKKILDNSLTMEIDSKIKTSSVLKTLKTKAQGNIPGDEAFPISEIRPTLYALNIPNQTIFVASYTVERKQYIQEGPRVIIINGKLYPLTGWCSYPFFRVFTLNGAYYLESGSGCCGCGITIQELFEIKHDSVVTVWDDASYSD